MFHLFYFFSRKAGMERAAFFHHYLAVHTHAGRPVSYIKHYLQNHRIYAIDSDSIYDAATEIWSEELISNRAAAEDPGAAARVADEHNFIDGGRTERLLTTDHVMLAGSQRTGMIQATFHLRRPPGWTVDEFRRHWAEVHAPVTLKLPGIRHYQQAVTVDEAYDYAVPKTDGLEQIWFEDVAQTGDRPNSATCFLPSLQEVAEVNFRFCAEVQLLVWPGKDKEQVGEEIKRRVEQGWS